MGEFDLAAGVLHDPLAVAFTGDPKLCPVKPARIVVDEKCFTRVETGPPNVNVCLHSDRNVVLDYYMGRIVRLRHITE